MSWESEVKRLFRTEGAEEKIMCEFSPWYIKLLIFIVLCIIRLGQEVRRWYMWRQCIWRGWDDHGIANSLFVFENWLFTSFEWNFTAPGLRPLPFFYSTSSGKCSVLIFNWWHEFAWLSVLYSYIGPLTWISLHSNPISACDQPGKLCPIISFVP